MKIIRIFHLKIFIFLVVKISVYLNRHVFEMSCLSYDVSVNSLFIHVRLHVFCQSSLFAHAYCTRQLGHSKLSHKIML